VISLDRPPGRPLVIGHRGAAALAPENTLASFRAAAVAGVDLIEFDGLALGDGTLVVAHSNDLREVSHGAATGSVRDRTLEELRTVAPQLPTLQEALAFFAVEAPSTGVHVDVKTAGWEEELVALLRHHDLVQRTFVSSFLQKPLHTLARLEPELRLGVSFPRDRAGISKRPLLAPIASAGLAALRLASPYVARVLLARSGVSALVLHHPLVTRAVVVAAHRRGAPVVAWTVDGPLEIRRVSIAGVAALVTNDPATALATLKA
jgi:glycerophosphoryl diester phosphodiesterase